MFEVGQTIQGFARLSEEFRGAMFNSILRGYATDRGDVEYLVTSGAPQTRPLDDVRRELTYAGKGMQVPGFVSEANGVQYLAEETPGGHPLAYADRPLPPKMVARLLVESAEMIEKAHQRGVTLFGVRPELIWADGWMIDASKHDLHVVGMTPRTMRFLLGMRPMRGGLCLDDAYSPPEVWKGDATGPAVDVFGLCAVGYFLLTHRAPFPADGDFNAAVRLVCSGAPPDWSGVAFANVLSAGLAPDPAARPTLAALSAALA